MENVSFTYEQGQTALKNITLDVKKGEFLVVGGKSGCGKTTLGRVINGLAFGFYRGKLGGKVLVDGEDTAGMALWEIGERVASVFQDPSSQFFAHRVRDEIAFAAENYGLEKEIILERLDRITAELGMADLLDKDMFSLSSGEQQKVAIVSALIIDLPIFVLDEPSANLDAEGTEALGRMLSLFKRQGKTVIIVEHRLYYLTGLMDRFVYMNQGRIQTVYNREELLSISQETLTAMGLRTLQTPMFSLNSRGCKGGQPSLDVKELTFGYSKKAVFSGINFEACKGEIIALLGRNGIGKTTFCKILAGLLKEKHGSITLNGKTPGWKQRQRKTFFVMQEAELQLFGESVSEELALGFRTNERDESILESLGLADLKELHPATLSGGQKQRLIQAVSKKSDRDILIFDEPTSGLDGENMLKTKVFFEKLSAEGKTILVVTHDLEFVATCCHRAVVLKIKENEWFFDEWDS